MATPDQKFPKHQGAQSLRDKLDGDNINASEAERTSTPPSTKAVDSQTLPEPPNTATNVTLKRFYLVRSKKNPKLFVVYRIEFLYGAQVDSYTPLNPPARSYAARMLAAIILRSLQDGTEEHEKLQLRSNPKRLFIGAGDNLSKNKYRGFNDEVFYQQPSQYISYEEIGVFNFTPKFDTTQFDINIAKGEFGKDEILAQGTNRTRDFKYLIERFELDVATTKDGFDLSDRFSIQPTEIVTNPTDDTSTELSVMNSPAQDESQPTKAENLEQGNAPSTSTEASHGNNHTERISLKNADKGADSHSAATDLEATAAEAPTEESASIKAQPALAEEPKPSNEEDQNQKVDQIALAPEIHSSASSEVDSNPTLDKRVAAQQSSPHHSAPWIKNRVHLLSAVLILSAFMTLVYSFSQNTHSSREFVLPLKQRLLTELDFDTNGIAVWFSAAEDDIRYPSSNAQGLVNVPSDPVSFEDKLSVFRDFMALPGNFPRYQPGAHRKYISDAFDVQADVSKFIIEYDGIDCDAFFFIASDNSMDLVHNLTTDVSVFLKQPLIPGKTYRIIAIVIPNGRYLENPPLSLRFVHTP